MSTHPSSDTDLLFAVLALQMNFVTRDQLVECGALWASDRSKRLADLLQEKGYLRESTRKALEAMVKEHTDRLGKGDPAQSLVSLSLDAEAEDSLLALPLDDGVRATLNLRRKTRRTRGTLVVAQPGQDRYVRGSEIGRGGLSRIFAAVDTVLNREVAVKELKGKAGSAAQLERFLREGEIAGRLSHPNVIPVHDIGARDEAGEKVPYFVMSRIVGRDLREIVRAVEKGEGEARGEYTRPRLLRIFQDVCLAAAYAHDRGVIHRDLKPANVMVGDFGEVFVVDWGLAKVIGRDGILDGEKGRGGDEEKPSPDRPIVPSPHRISGEPSPPPPVAQSPPRIASATQSQTMEGDILGTPAYMPPEQAGGQGVDERSDIYALGAILYEILTFRPPYVGESAFHVLAQVAEGRLVPPSERVLEVHGMGTSSDPDAPDPVDPSPAPAGGLPELGQVNQDRWLYPQPVPPELDEIVLKAMAFEREERFRSARELFDEVQRFLEGEKERERNHRKALEKIAEGKKLLDSVRERREALRELEKEEKEKSGALVPSWSVEKKRPLWELRKGLEALREEIVRRFSKAGRAFQAALEFERGNPDARAALADMYRDQFLREEKAGHRTDMVFYENLVREYDDGRFEDLLKGDGTLAVTTKAYPCRCLVEGREVAPTELEIGGFHPLSGRSLAGWEGAEGVPSLEPPDPIRLKVHGPGCAPEPLEGADVWLFLLTEMDRLLVPCFPDGVTCAAPESVECRVFGVEKEEASHGREDSNLLDTLHFTLNTLFESDSPYRPKGGLYLGRTPLPETKLPMGRYLLIVAKEGRFPARIPVHVKRNAAVAVDATLFGEGEVPDGFLPVAGGEFDFQGDRENPYSGELEVRVPGDFFLARFPVTCRDYARFLEVLNARDPEETRRRVPREAPASGAYWPSDDAGGFDIPTEAWVKSASPDLSKRASKLANAPVWWDEDWPVFGVSWEDLMEYAAWWRECTGFLATLPTDEQWEKAARGVDRRLYPWGNEDEASYYNNMYTLKEGMRPCRVTSHPTDESPYGVRGLGGNSRDYCLDVPGKSHAKMRLGRGGYWALSGVNSRSTTRTVCTPVTVTFFLGGRLAILPRVPA